MAVRIGYDKRGFLHLSWGAVGDADIANALVFIESYRDN